MLLQKKGFPQEDELVLCTVTKVQFHSVFVTLDEYGKGGMIHISEVSPGRIRNIRDFVREGKKIVCKVLRVNEERGHIDLSLRRVAETQKRLKLDEIKQEQKAEKILEFVAKDINVTQKKLFDDIVANVQAKYATMYEFFQQVAADANTVKDAGLDEKAAKALEEAIKQRIKEANVEIGGKLKLVSYAADGVEVIKEALKRAQESGDGDKVQIRYLGAGTYRISVNSRDYKGAEKILDKASESALAYIKENDGKGEFAREGA